MVCLQLFWRWLYSGCQYKIEIQSMSSILRQFIQWIVVWNVHNSCVIPLCLAIYVFSFIKLVKTVSVIVIALNLLNCTMFSLHRFHTIVYIWEFQPNANRPLSDGPCFEVQNVECVGRDEDLGGGLYSEVQVEQVWTCLWAAGRGGGAESCTKEGLGSVQRGGRALHGTTPHPGQNDWVKDRHNWKHYLRHSVDGR